MSISIFNNVDLLPPDALFNIKNRFTQDQRALKVDLGIGAYRDDNGKPWILPSVRQAEALIQADPNYNHEYLGIGGLDELTVNAAKLIFGDDSSALSEGRVVSVQSLSGTGALHTAAKFLCKFSSDRSIYLSDPTWANHKQIFETQGFKTATYPYWNPKTKSLNLEGVLEAVRHAPNSSIFVLHACAHNPTGLDPNYSEWNHILDEIVKKEHIVIFDSAYQGFASGNLDNDAYAVRLGLEKLASISPVIVCQSFAKNFGMYGERTGCFHLILPRQPGINNSPIKNAIMSQLNNITRSELSNPPAYGAKIVSTILNDPFLTNEWHHDLVTMSNRITKMRHILYNKLVDLKTPGTWNHIIEQCGMFSYTGLTPEMISRLESKHAVYMVGSGRASIAGLNEQNVEYVAKSIDEVVRYFESKF